MRIRDRKIKKKETNELIYFTELWYVNPPFELEIVERVLVHIVYNVSKTH